MKYSGKIYEKAFNIIKQRRMEGEISLTQRKEEIYQAIPKIKSIDEEMASVSIRVARAVLAKSGDIPALIEGLRQRNLLLTSQKSSLLAKNGVPSDYLSPHIICENCADTGFAMGKRCVCFEEQLKIAAFEELNKVSPLKLSGFDTFDLNYYSKEKASSGFSPYEMMKSVYDYCRAYSEHFSLQSPSLLFTGGTGLGKTHLSLAVTKSAIEKGHGVIYDSCQNILTKMEREYFGKDKSFDDFTSAVYECDLLVLDDLGVEFSTSFTQSMIYNIINTRLNASLPTIISTNLSTKELAEKYTDRVVSRIVAIYEIFSFKGNDIRLQKMIKNRS